MYIYVSCTIHDSTYCMYTQKVRNICKYDVKNLIIFEYIHIYVLHCNKNHLGILRDFIIQVLSKTTLTDEIFAM
jgi:hypothetical protein